MLTPQIRVAIDIGSRCHRVAIAGPNGQLLEEFDLAHTGLGFADFFRRVASQEQRLGGTVVVAMEGFNGHARPLDSQIQAQGYRLFNVNNLKLARFKEIFPGPAKSDPIDARKMLELFELREHLPLAKEVLQEVASPPLENEQLKRLTRRRRQLVNDKVRLDNRLQADLQAVCPGLLEITGDVDNLWFLRFLTCRDELTKLAHLRWTSLLKLPGIGPTYAARIQHWQPQAYFAPAVAWVGEMILQDAHQILALLTQIKRLNTQIAALAESSELAQHLRSIPGFGPTCSAELAGEIGTPARFASESSLALYLGMAALDNSSGTYRGSKTPRQVNTHAKAAMMTGVDRHRKQVPRSQRYYEKKRAEGKTHNQAIRALGRHLVRVIWALIRDGRDYEIR
jgi:transposase